MSIVGFDSSQKPSFLFGSNFCILCPQNKTVERQSFFCGVSLTKSEPITNRILMPTNRTLRVRGGSELPRTL